jgi:integrase
MGHVVKTPAGSFRANWRDATGRQKAKTFPTRKEAAAFLATTETSLVRGTYVDPNAGRIRFGEFAARWLLSRDVEARTAERTLSLIRTHVLPRWRDWPLNRIDYMSIQEWATELRRSLAPATVTKCVGVLVMVFRAAVRARLVAHNPAEEIRIPGGSNERVARAVAITRAQFFGRLLPVIPADHQAIVCTAAGAGLRWGECTGLAWNAVDLDAGVLRVRQVLVETPGTLALRPYPKTRAGMRDIPIPAFLVTALAEHRDRSEGRPVSDGLVFTSDAGTPLRRSNFRRRVWSPAVASAGLPATLRFHDLRHSYATWLVSDGLPVNVVQHVMGHQRASTTLDRYTHSTRDHDDQVRAALTGAADDSLTVDGSDEPDDGDDPGVACPVPA